MDFGNSLCVTLLHVRIFVTSVISFYKFSMLSWKRLLKCLFILWLFKYQVGDDANSITQNGVNKAVFNISSPFQGNSVGIVW